MQRAGWCFRWKSSVGRTSPAGPSLCLKHGLQDLAAEGTKNKTKTLSESSQQNLRSSVWINKKIYVVQTVYMIQFYSVLTNIGCTIRKAISVHVVGQQEGALFQHIQEHGGGVGLLCAVHVLPWLQGLWTEQVVHCLHHRLEHVALITMQHPVVWCGYDYLLKKKLSWHYFII